MPTVPLPLHLPCARPGLQTQTAECLVVGEVATSRMVVALNKVGARIYEQRLILEWDSVPQHSLPPAKPLVLFVSSTGCSLQPVWVGAQAPNPLPGVASPALHPLAPPSALPPHPPVRPPAPPLQVDQLQPESERPKAVRRAMKRLAATFAMTKFAGVQMIPVSAKPGGLPRSRSCQFQTYKGFTWTLCPCLPQSADASNAG